MISLHKDAARLVRQPSDAAQQDVRQPGESRGINEQMEKEKSTAINSEAGAQGRKGPLDRVRVLEMGHLLAAPFASAFLAWFGAEVIKVEPPGTGDPIRTWRVMHKGTSLWWLILGRNKKCVTLDLRAPRGQEIARQLAARVDVVLENFNPGTLERWGLGYDELQRINPRLILARISGYGQTGPYAHKPGFASVAEGFGGLRYVTGHPDKPPARPNLSLGDSLAGLHAALGILLALYQRDARGGGTGQVVDVAIYEAVYNMMENVVPEYDKAGVVREREGMRLTGIVPSGTYPCNDGAYIIIGANSDGIFKRLMAAMGREDMASDPRLAQNDDRVRHLDEIDQAITAWTRRRPSRDLLRALEAAGVPAGPIYSVADMLGDPQYNARGMFEEVELDGGDRVKLPTMAPRLSGTPGGSAWIGPALGAHNREVFGGMLGYADEELKKLEAEGII